MSDIVETALDPRECEQRVHTAADGAMVTFTGIVRDHHGGRSVTALRYQAHPQADRFLQEVLARHRSHEVQVAAQHRVGDLAIGDLAVVVAVAAPHRGAAFEVCAQLIDEIKTQVPIWKFETYADGDSVWVNACS
ncbi:molybdopterin synthase large subunit MoaE [Gordonia hirsuta DSM 44140 = NBRC 16056]|uniref:Molybdopterin synthase large subunit MoaE n=1 Tax=Gordonia hirsuta DSM 44140 = NBRC 16056 TaxID=1121927 RepID=L7LC35_9ACTN|nr:molybdenum cofactor biosynthesis protein MoaE [Gordonia hirsuta]GAC57593.1 molybdopterin synthase large subunit MoaE [Gordonia hirsuta DSM 44140 = NBRC 16056]